MADGLTIAVRRSPAAAGVMATAVSYAADLVALRYVPPRFFGVFMSVTVVVLANAVAVAAGGRRRAESCRQAPARQLVRAT
jgi:inner membrane transporter RhtA